jgi:hypothetical protein
MVKPTGKLRTFEVELREAGSDPRVVASDVSMDVARSMCRQLVGPDRRAVVRPRDGQSCNREADAPKYAIWLWNEQRMCWERLIRRQQLSLSEAAAWLQDHADALGDRLTMLAPAHLKRPA